MTLSSNFRTGILSRHWLGGTFINLGCSLTVEMAGRAGFDWILLDHEHGPGGEETLLHQIQAAAITPVATIVRIAANEPTRFKRALDLGAGGVMVPYVSTEAEARAAVAAVRYPPRGMRGVSKANRAAGFGRDFADYFAHHHERLVTMVQIETPESVENSAAIAAVDGVDVLFIGPLDLTVNLGIAGEFEHPRFIAARRQVVQAAERAGKAAGILLSDVAQVPVVRAEGFTAVCLGSDGSAVMAGLAQAVTALKSK